MAHIRLNGGGRCRMLSEYPFAEGTFKLCWKAEYLDGFRRGETAIIKQFKEGCVYEDYYFNEELTIIEITGKIAEAFNKAKILGGNRLVRVSRPDIATSVNTGAKALVEPYIDMFEKFNSNSGWVNTDCGVLGDAMQALSHFSYHEWDGEYLLCDLQGGAYRDGFVLSDPIVLTKNGNLGPGDLGKEGMKSFFQKHRCNWFCKSHWRTPSGGGRSRIPSKKGTVYDLRSGPSRNPLWGLYW